MLPDLKECETLSLKLAAAERAVLAQHLITSLDTLDDAENERLWLEEADRRYQAYKLGRISARSAEEAICNVRARIK